MHNLEFIPLEALASLKVVNWYSVCTDFLEASLVVLKALQLLSTLAPLYYSENVVLIARKNCYSELFSFLSDISGT